MFTEDESYTIIGFSEACVAKNKFLRIKLRGINTEIKTLVDELNSLSKLLEPQRKQGYTKLLNKLLGERVERLNGIRAEKADIKSQIKDNSAVTSFVKKAFKLEDAS